MAKRKEKYKPKQFESSGASNDTSANIYMSMLMSDAWQKLTKNAQVLYVYCKSQYYAEKNKPKPIIRQLDETQQKMCFTMNQSKWRDLYHIYTNKSQFYKDINQLVEYGFIEIVENGRNTFSKTIYMFSNEWQKKV